jgi:hypothetical protein
MALILMEWLRSLWKEHRGDSSIMIGGENIDIVMVADIDLYEFPPVDKIISQINNMGRMWCVWLGL